MDCERNDSCWLCANKGHYSSISNRDSNQTCTSRTKGTRWTQECDKGVNKDGCYLYDKKVLVHNPEILSTILYRRQGGCITDILI